MIDLLKPVTGATVMYTEAMYKFVMALREFSKCGADEETMKRIIHDYEKRHGGR